LADAQIAVLIDFENMGLESIRPLLDELADEGRIIIRRAYADWSKAASKRDELLQLGLDPIHVFRSSLSGKNSADIRLVIDAVELMYRSPVDTFVIVSSDSDFVPLVMTLRAAGKRVIAAGRHGIVSPTLVNSCDRFIYVDRQEGLQKTARARKPEAGKPAAAVPARRAEAMEDAVSLVLRAMHAAMDYQGRVSGSSLHQAMTRIDPSFDFRALGFRTFTQFLLGTGEVSVTYPRGLGQGDSIVELKASGNGAAHPSEPAPEPAPAPLPAPVVSEPTILPPWDERLEALLEERMRQTGQDRVSGAWAGDRAARILGAPSLKVSRYPTLRKLLESSDLLRERWSLEGGYLVRKSAASAGARPGDGGGRPVSTARSEGAPAEKEPGALHPANA
jgi:uncharacterized protein (TIGR00288 family)